MYALSHLPVFELTWTGFLDSGYQHRFWPDPSSGCFPRERSPASNTIQPGTLKCPAER